MPGFEMKQSIIDWLTSQEIQVTDFGTNSGV
jgi:ribose 5-phosphate isomerase RpiB